MEIRIHWEEMSEKDIADLARSAESELARRLVRYSVYEPTGDPVRDREHHQKKQALEELLNSIKR